MFKSYLLSNCILHNYCYYEQVNILLINNKGKKYGVKIGTRRCLVFSYLHKPEQYGMVLIVIDCWNSPILSTKSIDVVDCDRNVLRSNLSC